MSEPLTIRCRENGPFVIVGPVRVVDHAGIEFPIPAEKDKVALCRCGHSAIKPFCDGSHKTSGFQACELAAKPAGA